MSGKAAKKVRKKKAVFPPAANLSLTVVWLYFILPY